MEKITIDSPEAKTKNIVSDNITKLKELFPEVFSEGKIDFNSLQELLGENIERDKERYQLNWNGKSAARREALKPSTGTLRPCKEESVDWDKTKNLYIEGDNLEVLKLLQKSYHNKVKMIYIDPPYNTGKDFVYKDNFKDNLKNYLEQTGQTDEYGIKISTNTEASGRMHSNWLNMMYPRLKLARNLLLDDGVIFISIGNEELDRLKLISDEIFGETNHITTISRLAKKGGASGRFFSPNVEFILVYSRKIDSLTNFKDEMDEGLIKKVYTNKQNDGLRKGEKYRTMGLYQASLTLERSRNARYYIKCPNGDKVIPPEGKRWRVVEESYFKMLEVGNIEFKETNSSPLFDDKGVKSKWNIYTKIWLKDREDEGMLPNDFIDKYENRLSSKELQKIGIPFDFAKPSELVKYLSKIINSKDALILDFFSGSSTTAHAVMQLNSEDGGNRQHIMVQLPEATDEKSEAFKAGYKNICEIGKERIRRAGKMIKEDNKDKEGIDKLDTGFKVFKLDSSNIASWDVSSDIEGDALEQKLFDAVDNIKLDRSNEDVLFEILLKYNIDLSTSTKEYTFAGKKVYSISHGLLIICLDNDISIDTVQQIANMDSDISPNDIKVVFKDAGFASSVVKTNAVQILKNEGITNVKSI